MAKKINPDEWPVTKKNEFVTELNTFRKENEKYIYSLFKKAKEEHKNFSSIPSTSLSSIIGRINTSIDRYLIRLSGGVEVTSKMSGN